jgi:hypothetical protein
MSNWFPLLKDSDINTRRDAQDALAAIGEPALPKLFEIIYGSIDPTEVTAALECARRIHLPSLPYFAEGLKSSHSVTRVQSAWSMMLVCRGLAKSPEVVATHLDDMRRIFLENLRHDDATTKI